MTRTAKTCPLCRQPSQPAFTPFCSEGCRSRDLLRWLDEGYRIPSAPGDDAESGGLDSPSHSG